MTQDTNENKTIDTSEHENKRYPFIVIDEWDNGHSRSNSPLVRGVKDLLNQKIQEGIESGKNTDTDNNINTAASEE